MHGKTTKPIFLYTQRGIASFLKFRALKKKMVQNSIEEYRGSTTQEKVLTCMKCRNDKLVVFERKKKKKKTTRGRKLSYGRTLEFPWSAKRGENTAKPALS
ncbi:hypothetical protein L873DRAFT_1811593 [Choiromyces venosus 120613-1]|uniref:Uncharacterized protein n=1 Tax=Choiromyces venosus 120613-1 TaxID=1336337 RepID=A0A3N4JHC4_9PEZI|nr:hypothetical protein L873DRAFT_1811593 [Choiromyces venosus 120613-1]